MVQEPLALNLRWIVSKGGCDDPLSPPWTCLQSDCLSSHQEVESISLTPESGLDRLWLTDCGRMTHGISEPRPQEASLSSLAFLEP